MNHPIPLGELSLFPTDKDNVNVSTRESQTFRLQQNKLKAILAARGWQELSWASSLECGPKLQPLNVAISIGHHSEDAQ